MISVIGRIGPRHATGWAVLAALMLGLFRAPPTMAEPPEQAQPIMTVDEVKVGMLGYGMTVFHGDKIEPFPFRVMSVIPNSNPKRAVVWVDCYGERMQKTGPVQGMSGSPMYVWEEGEEGTLGEGGRLLGAFAFGYAFTNQCMVGVQPIEYMREVGDRSTQTVESGAFAAGRGARPGLGAAMIAGLSDYAEQLGTTPSERLRLDAARHILNATPWGRRETSARPNESTDGPVPLMLPMSVGSAETADLMKPLLQPLGILPQAGGTMGGPPPSNVDADRVELEPGSILAIPLAFGDYVPAAIGTVTDVLPDGTVLGFGHRMDGTGDTALPMATGYVHFIMSSITNSFKRSGVIALKGSITQDEAAAVAGHDQVAYTTSPVSATIRLPEQPERTYRYEVVNHPGYTPSIAVLMPVVALSAVAEPPELNTMHLTGTVTFNDGRTLNMDALLPFGRRASVAYEVAPIMGAVLANEFEPLELASMDVTLEVEPEVRLAYIQGVSVSPAVAAPGETVEITVQLQPYGEAATSQTFAFTVPSHVNDGEYFLSVGDAATYQRQLFQTQPQWQVIEDLDELFEAYEMSLSLRRNAVYVSLMLEPLSGLAVGNASMPNLPSSRMALLARPNNTAVQPATPTIDAAYPTDDVIMGEFGVPLTVKHDK